MSTKLILTETEANKIAKYLTGFLDSISGSQTVWMALGSNDAVADKSFVEITPNAANNYARAMIKSDAAYPDVLSVNGRTVTNHEQIVFNKVLTSAYTAKSIALFRQETGGAPYAYGTLEADVPCSVGSLPMFERNAFELTIPDGTES